MVQDPTLLKESPSQTAGPFVHIGTHPWAVGVEGVFDAGFGQVVAGPDCPGERVRIEVRLFDGDGQPVRDAVVETWQADPNGIFASPLDPRHARVAPDFTGWGRFACGFEDGGFAFETVKPGPVPGPRGSTMAPHICLWIVARGINIGLSTRLYFPEEAAANAADPILARVDGPARRATLIAEAAGEGAYRFDVRLQGEGETVFFAT
jgi:protocatechuate 3,4-dioxygenase alpha subunit